MPARKYTEQQRLEFMTVIDRGGSVRAATIAVGAHPDRGYQWMKQAGLSTPRSTQRKYTAGEKAEFFKRLEEVGNVSEVARELGFNRVSCYVWAHKGRDLHGCIFRCEAAGVFSVATRGCVPA